LKARAAGALAWILLLGSCSRQKTAVDATSVAEVNGEVISREDLQRELRQEAGGSAPLEALSPAALEAFERDVLQNLIDRVLLLRAAKQLNIFVSPEEVEREVLRLRSDYPSDGFERALAEGQLSLAELKQKTSALLTIERLFQQQVYAQRAVTEDEVRQYYEQHSAEFQEPEQVRAAQIVVKTAEEARQIQRQLRSGHSFAELARKHSLSPDARQGGDLGYFPKGRMPAQFDEVAFKLPLNQVSDVISTPYGFHLFKVLAKKPASRQPFAEVRAQLQQRLLSDKRQQAQADFIEALRSKASIKVNPATLAAGQTVGGPGKSDASQ
jgi:peptidyl-prolyl cis-trans isomerase C/foldase protein PrsA